MAKMTPRTLSGFMELLPQPQQQMERMMQILRETYALYGFTPLDTPIIEASEVLLAKGGGGSFTRRILMSSATASWTSPTRRRFLPLFTRPLPVWG